MLKSSNQLRAWLPVCVSALLLVVLLLIPTGFESAAKFTEAETCTAEVLDVDNSTIIDTGLIRSGEQTCTLRITSGLFKGRTAEGVNMLNGSLEQDKLFAVGDSAQVRINYSGDTILSVSMVDHNRIPGEIILLLCFFLFLILFAGMTGVRAILSFAVSVLLIWKVLVPCCLKGYDPLLVGGLVTAALTVTIIALVYGFDRRCFAACAGSIAGLVVTCILSVVCTTEFKIHGAVMSYSESLLYSGYQNLNLTRIFMASVFIGASGAMMDLTVDITSAIHEVVLKRPDISRREAIISGMHVGRAAMGTMTTTLLLAYSGGYLALLMVFMAQGTPLSSIFNYKYVASELIHTLIGSFGLVTAAPLTAFAAGMSLAGRQPVPPDIPQDGEAAAPTVPGAETDGPSAVEQE